MLPFAGDDAILLALVKATMDYVAATEPSLPVPLGFAVYVDAVIAEIAG